MPEIAAIVGSTRPHRHGPAVAAWVVEVSKQIDAPIEVVDLADVDLPLLDEPEPAALSSDYVHPHTRSWADTVARYDGFVFVTPEYNHSMPAALKNALDFLYHEWNTKAAGFVTYGIHGGVRAAEHLRLVCAELQIATVRTQVALSLADDFDGAHRFAPRKQHTTVLLRMLDELIAWSSALRQSRQLELGPEAPARDGVVVVGRARWKMREALRVLRNAGYSAVGTFNDDGAAKAIATAEDLLAVVLGGSVSAGSAERLRLLAASRGASTVRTAINHTDPAQHFTDDVLPQLEEIRRLRHRTLA
jgi:NAD(P)H-dependent FMN reductase